MARHSRPPVPSAAEGRLVGVRLADGGAELTAAAACLRRAAEQAGRKARALGRPVLAWTTARIARRDPLAIFDRAGRGDGDRVLWESPANQLGLAGVGSAWTVTADGRERFKRTGAAWRSVLEAAVGDGPTSERGVAGPIVMGGFAFTPAGPRSAEWDGYPAGMLVLPRVSVASTAEASWITLAVLVQPEPRATPDAEGEVAACLNEGARLLGHGTPAADARKDSAPALVEESPPAEAWKEMVRKAAAAVSDGRLTKVVLARAIRIRGRLEPVKILWRLRAAYPECTRFAVTRADRCFLGATPERLVRLRNDELSVAAVAGSAPRGATEEEDRRLGEGLLANFKDRLEHAVVVSALRDALGGICTTVSADADPGLLKVGSVQHLHTPLTATLRDRRTVLELADLLHPTPAVGGVPQDDALRWIAAHEGLDRGWYAGPVGWMDHAGNGEFAVAIRSALLRGGEALLFAGCGIMASSDPDQEYAESWLKLRSVLSALNGA